MVDAATRLTTKDLFLADPDVVELSEWIAPRLRHSSGWMHTYVDRKTGARWSCNGLADAFRQYSWRGKAWPVTKVGLDRLRHDLRDAVKRESADEVVEVCGQILAWGGVSAHNVHYLTSRKDALIRELRHLSAVLARNRTPSKREMLSDPADQATACRMKRQGRCSPWVSRDETDRSWSPQTIRPDVAIEGTQKCAGDSMPSPRDLRWRSHSETPGRDRTREAVRDPSRGSLRFPKLGQDSRFHTVQIMRANAPHSVARRLSVKERTDFTNGAAGLFMVGYDLGPANRNGIAGAPAARCKQPAVMAERTVDAEPPRLLGGW